MPKAPIVPTANIHHCLCRRNDQTREPSDTKRSTIRKGCRNDTLTANPKPIEAKNAPKAGMHSGQTIATSAENTDAIWATHFGLEVTFAIMPALSLRI